MKFSLTSLAVAASFVSASVNILLTNDDSWGTANIRETKRALEAAGHKVLLLGPLENQSGVGGAVILPTSNVSSTGGLYGFAMPGASYYGFNQSDNSIRYFNGTPAAAALWGLNKAQDFFAPGVIDLVVSGPNEGTNLGPLVWTLSGTCGAAYTSVMYGTPAIAFSARNSSHRSYLQYNPNDKNDSSVIAGALIAQLVTSLDGSWNRTGNNTILPLGSGLNVNFPYLNGSCTSPPFVRTRFTGGAVTDDFVINSSGFPTYVDLVRPGLNKCVTGDCSLPGETDVVKTCRSSVSVFMVDPDATTDLAQPVNSFIDSKLVPLNKQMRMKRSLAEEGRLGRRKAL